MIFSGILLIHGTLFWKFDGFSREILTREGSLFKNRVVTLR